MASRSLFDAIERQALSPRASLRRDNKLLRYLIRMSTLPTPYGLFAGVALGDWGLRRICPLLIPWRTFK